MKSKMKQPSDIPTPRFEHATTRPQRRPSALWQCAGRWTKLFFMFSKHGFPVLGIPYLCQSGVLLDNRGISNVESDYSMASTKLHNKYDFLSLPTTTDNSPPHYISIITCLSSRLKLSIWQCFTNWHCK